MWFIWVLFVGLFFLHLYQCLRLRKRPPILGGAWPIIGNSLMALKNLQSLIETETNNCIRRGIDIATLRLGAWDIYVLINPEDCLLVANSCLTKDSLYDLLKPYFGEGLITANGHRWIKQRKFLNPSFNQQVIDGYLSEFNVGAKKLVGILDKEVGKGYFDHSCYIDNSILSTVCVTTIGSIIDDEDKHNIECFMIAKLKFYDCLLQRVTKFWLHSDLVYQISGLKRREDIHAKEMRELSQAILIKKKAEFKLKKLQLEDISSKTRFKPLMEHLLESSQEGEISDKEVTDQVNTFTAAASDTTSGAITYVILCVGSYKTVQQKIFDELQLVFEGSDRDVEKQDLPRLRYLEAVIKETMRLYPTVSLIGRTLDTDLQINNYTLPAGGKCFLGLYGLLRHPPTWGPDAAEFRPERWLDGTLPANHKVFAAFGIGKRSCIGSNFAVMLMKTYLARFFRSYSVSGDVTRLVQTFEVLSRPASGHYISIKRRC